jgi:hypothetical protein
MRGDFAWRMLPGRSAFCERGRRDKVALRAARARHCLRRLLCKRRDIGCRSKSGRSTARACGVEQPCASRRAGRVQHLDGAFLHFCCHCGRFAAFGYGVHLRAGRLGRWYCGEIDRFNNCFYLFDRDDRKRYPTARLCRRTRALGLGADTAKRAAGTRTTLTSQLLRTTAGV